MKMTTPGPTDCEWMSVTLAGEQAHVEFHEERDEAVEAAEANLAPGVSTYVGRLELQGENVLRGRGRPIGVVVRVTSELRDRLAERFPDLRKRNQLGKALLALVEIAEAALAHEDGDLSRADYVKALEKIA